MLKELLELQPELAPDRRVEIPWVINQLEKTGIVLDVGCGGGIIGKYLENKGFAVIAMDVDKKMGATYFDRSKRKFFVLCDCFHAPFKREIFDYIIVISTVEHFKEDDGEALNALSFLLKIGGKMLVTVPYGESKWLANRIVRIYSEGDLMRRLVLISRLHLISKKIFILDWEMNIACLELKK